jgi:hypothetical protein
MITFYDDDPVYVTDQWFINGHRQYPISCLRNLRRPHITPPLAVTRSVILTVLPLLIPAAFGAALPAAITVAMSVAIIPVTLAAGMVLHRRGRVHILLADFGGSTVRLYQTSNTTEFGKLIRALTRAYT